MPDYSVAIPESISKELNDFLIRFDRQENLLFALYTLSSGATRTTALLHTLIYPEKDEHQIHGNVSFNRSYLERVYNLAMQNEQCGIVFLHSHPGVGWQDMSEDDIAAEQYISRGAMTCTNLPLVGLTVGADSVWSARFWIDSGQGVFLRQWCTHVRCVGKHLKTDWANRIVHKPHLNPIFQNSATVFGETFPDVQRLRIGIVGLGSVGGHVAESLARLGMTRFTLIDFDEIQKHNLDRLVGASRDDLGKLKVDVAKQHIDRCATGENIVVEPLQSSIIEKEGYLAALDCDILFSCVDRPWARKILNHIAFAHLIPVIDGGIAVRMKESFSGVDWQLQTATLGNVCLKCAGCYNDTEVDLDKQGLLDDPTYMRQQNSINQTLAKRNENIFPFSANLASLEVIQMIALVTGSEDFGIQRYRFHPGILESHLETQLPPCNCMNSFIAQGDRHFTLIDTDKTAENARIRQVEKLN